ncbi:3-hydroxyacyl-CoA dehydrogenase [Streptomyces rapamycinicus]|uniref:3-hydroxyacyl-CoA dehydrogenase n=2 Tax=Streptomyces rapamycinicus TaxID=1226757 RepID=A0A0A0NQ09_STRRN|nr:3-hydroxyacyl-CoA dehydrogenase [Streptomyces rapamycinicus]AGP56475.1 3-hydroxyacyl-CoA dehydrogenase [Streptomyces rapamycinicus NRRL 5491]MBB4784077.1 3-hydroxybutyryl-CoA dehydrogenase [Streptomyces rapamycinicus]RLV80438.1 3-hydroxyacyl-CoA dehydrogenase [Streptomyces rapamycinicus NRRL 5491]UTO64417.1 3-hydroxyacyl-CoA dehydrogenase [Streptomyces rapamycinicus]UTP32373.1 3-hydroxyacyl-CoA dehydrogenase [Streptomyces rapamycinicus NRRL 5491]
MTAIDRGTDRAGLVAVVGTGTMGQGIAQVALVAGHPVRLYDAAPGRASRAAGAIADRLGRLVAKERLSAAGRDTALGRLTPVTDLADLAEAELVVEAILEELGAKQQLFTALESVVSDGCLLATNTSSLSVTAVAGVLRRPGRLLGLHFFNPAPLMPLVEVVRGAATDEAAADRAQATVAAWGKTPVRCADTPGFIVNRIARPFYAEAFRAYEERVADPATLDAVLRESGGFRMGPFELTDLIGQDVNEAVTRSVWEALFHDPRFTPSLAQRQLVASGRHGRKTGHGWYDHAQGAGRPAPHTAEPCEPPGKVALHGDLGPAQGLVGLIEEAGIPVTHEPVGAHLALPDGTRLSLADGTTATEDPFAASVRFDLALDYRTATRVALAASTAAPEESLRSAVGLFQALGKEVSVVQDVPGMVVARTVAMLVDFAEDAVARGVAAPEDVDTAMLTGVNYPRGPLAWGRVLGARWVRDTLRNLHHACPTGRYAPSQALIRRAAADERLL